MQKGGRRFSGSAGQMSPESNSKGGRGRVCMRYGIPKARAGQKIGLLGGSFDPPHHGHVHISQAALTRFDLDEVWWLVSPGNPLKKNRPASIDKRMGACRALIRHPRIRVTDFEAKVGTQYTAETLQALRKIYGGVNFVWLMGADNLASFHLWDRWTRIMETVPIGILSRPDDRNSARMSPAAKRYARFRLPGNQSSLLALAPPPAWCFVSMPMVEASSTELRQRGGWSDG